MNLNRATDAYRKGFWDCERQLPKAFEDNGMFYNRDYSEGWEACWNELYWSAQRDNAKRS